MGSPEVVSVRHSEPDGASQEGMTPRWSSGPSASIVSLEDLGTSPAWPPCAASAANASSTPVARIRRPSAPVVGLGPRASIVPADEKQALSALAADIGSGAGASTEDELMACRGAVSSRRAAFDQKPGQRCSSARPLARSASAAAAGIAACATAAPPQLLVASPCRATHAPVLSQVSVVPTPTPHSPARPRQDTSRPPPGSPSAPPSGPPPARLPSQLPAQRRLPGSTSQPVPGEMLVTKTSSAPAKACADTLADTPDEALALCRGAVMSRRAAFDRKV